jgi:hypothetical protein
VKDTGTYHLCCFYSKPDILPLATAAILELGYLMKEAFQCFIIFR